MKELTLFRGFPVSSNYVWSPFVIKLEARLRTSNVGYKLAVGSPKSAPKGKIPYITFESSSGTQTIGDSGLIGRALSNDGLLGDLNSKLTPAQRAQDLAIRAMMEDRLCFYNGRERWVDNYDTMRRGVLATVPWLLQPIIAWFAHSGMVRTLYGQGTGRLTDEEVTSFRQEVWEGADALLKEAKLASRGREGPFWVLGGTEPTEADMTLFGFVVSALVCDA